MIRRKKHFANRHVVSYPGEAALPSAAPRGNPDNSRNGPRQEPGADHGPRAYEATYLISSGYTADRAIVLP